MPPKSEIILYTIAIAIDLKSYYKVKRALTIWGAIEKKSNVVIAILQKLAF